VWLETLVQLKLRPKSGVTVVPFKNVGLRALSNSELKILLKLALYLNQESMLEPQLTDLTEDHIKDPEIREIVGHMYFRLGSPKKSYRFIEDLKFPNSETMKGNLYVWRKKYELAYAQFKLAIEQKVNSQNAMERLLPLAWLLKDWKGGQEYAERVIASSQAQVNKLTLVAAFLTQKGDHEKASDVLDIITQTSRRGSEVEVTQLYSFVNLMTNKPDLVRKHASQSCEQYDLMNCWLQFQMSQWDVFPLTMRRDEKISHKKEWEELVASTAQKPLKETIYVNQLDIEELDDKLIQLIPQKP
jgi:tetratricopeptide (TPR) repeat protein